MSPAGSGSGAESEVIVLGSGPAGCAASILLARRAHTVALVRPDRPPAAALAESVPPSARRVLEELGSLDALSRAGFHPNRGNTVWWAGREVRREDFPEGAEGFHTDRGSLEDVLVEVAEAAGVTVHHGARARSARRDGDRWTVTCEEPRGETVLHAPWVVDATGRTGLLARALRVPDRSTTTLALVRRWRRPGGWAPVPAHHTVVESYDRGWGWSVPLAPELRCFTVMIDHRTADLDDASLEAVLDAELRRTTRLATMVAGADAEGEAWACPASLYTARRFAEDGLLLAGDAGSFIDPLSSFGVKKALSSGWLAGIVTHTALVDPAMTARALDFFDGREGQVYRRYRAVSAPFFADAADVHGTPYWEARAEAARDAAGRAGGGRGPGGAPRIADPDDPMTPIPETAVRRAFESIKARTTLAAREGETVRRVEGPAVEGHRVVLQERLATDAVPEGLRFVRGIDLLRLVEVAQRHPDVPDGWAAYNAVAPAVTLPDYLTALATAFAAGILEHADG